MGVNRRQFLLGGLGLAAAATTIGLTGCAPGPVVAEVVAATPRRPT